MKKVLIANRGEIAARIIRTCQRLGVDTIAIYSDADRDLPYVKEATESYRIGEAPAQKSYMNGEAILDIAKRTEADGIHPGYGFLSENPDFVRQVHDAGLTFIGPSAEAVALMGDKIKARQRMQEAGVPVVPGSDGPCEDLAAARAVAEAIGYPVMLKAAAGGGGIGMTRCDSLSDLEQAFESNRQRAAAYFGDASMFVEKAIDGGHHIEVQIFADRYGRTVHLFERECSVQRRHQKVIEESPSPFISVSTRNKMTAAAIKAAEAVGYCNAGTVEFIVDQEENFYFLEMNTRLQVEHPVTEAITGYDLVEWQLRVADGERLPAVQNEIKSEGHAIEFRLYAEDPQTFLPSPGQIDLWTYPEIEGIRVDAGYGEGNRVTPFYDPMIAKIIAFGEDRSEAMDRATRFLRAMRIDGLKTNQALFLEILNMAAFQEGRYDTSILQTNGRRSNVK